MQHKINLDYLRNLLKKQQLTQPDAVCTTVFIHDMFVDIKVMASDISNSGGAGLIIHYSFAESPFGKLMLVSTSEGLCHMFFENSEACALTQVKQQFPRADYRQIADRFHRDALLVFQKGQRQPNTIPLYLAGTPFQLQVWRSLLKIPLAALTSYGDIAKYIGRPKAYRAVGAAGRLAAQSHRDGLCHH